MLSLSKIRTRLEARLSALSSIFQNFMDLPRDDLRLTGLQQPHSDLDTILRAGAKLDRRLPISEAADYFGRGDLQGRLIPTDPQVRSTIGDLRNEHFGRDSLQRSQTIGNQLYALFPFPPVGIMIALQNHLDCHHHAE